MARRFLFLPVLAAAALSACVSMSPDECLRADWQALGFQDGRAGEGMDTLDERRRQCTKAGAAVDATAYLRGREEGLRMYCDPRNAQELGLRGAGYAGVCPPDLAPLFRSRYEAGREVHRARDSLEDLDRRRRQFEDALAKAKGDDEKRQLRQQLSDLDGRLRSARNRLRDAERQLLP